MTRNKAGIKIYDAPYYETQAQRVVRKFGGPRNLARALAYVGKKKHPSAIYKWIYEQAFDKGGGLIPSHAMKDVLLAARAEGILLTIEDLDPNAKLIEPIKPRVHEPLPKVKKWTPNDKEEEK